MGPNATRSRASIAPRETQPVANHPQHGRVGRHVDGVGPAINVQRVFAHECTPFKGDVTTETSEASRQCGQGPHATVDGGVPQIEPRREDNPHANIWGQI